MNRAAQHRSDENPQKTRQESKLRRQDRADQRPGAGYRREMMAEEDKFISRMIIFAVAQGMRRGRPPAVQDKDFGNNELSVKAVRQRKYQ